MKCVFNSIKIITIFIILFLLIYFCTTSINNNIVKAALNESSTSDVQLIARAINRRSKRRKL